MLLMPSIVLLTCRINISAERSPWCLVRMCVQQGLKTADMAMAETYYEGVLMGAATCWLGWRWLLGRQAAGSLRSGSPGLETRLEKTKI